MKVSQRTTQPRDAGMGLLRPCPFCGAEAVLEPDPWLDESLRIVCGNDA